MVTIAELEQRISDNRREGRRLLSIDETLAVVAIIKAVENSHLLNYEIDLDSDPAVADAIESLARLP